MTACWALVLAYAVDMAFGEPPNRFHPVAWMGTLVARGRDWALGVRSPLAAGLPLGELGRGAVVALGVPMISAALALGALRAAANSPVLLLVVSAVLLKPMFAVRGLRDAAFAVRDALERGALDEARVALGSLCSRPAARLDRAAVVAATIESVAENTSDSVVAPLFFFACFGVPGAVFYRAVNTLDAMIGYHGRFEYVGKTAARLDDVLNFVPARLTALLLLAAGVVAQADVAGGIAILRRDGRRTESPNAGRPMATMAGLLGVKLEKEGAYSLGDARCPLESAHITASWRIAVRACGAAALLSALVGAVHA
jgi:adenosylcobinamide-phosphate synthase